MRSGLLLLFLALPSAALAAEDRYGPARRPDPVLAAGAPAAAPPAAATPAGGSGYSGRMLSWSNKAAPPSLQSSPSPEPVGAPAPRSPAPMAPAPTPPAPGPQAMASPAPSPAGRLPTGIYDGPSTPAPAPAPPAPAAWQPPQPVAAQPSATLPPPPSPAPIAGSAASFGAYNAPRAYSVVREYGGTPDRIPPPPPQSAFTGREVALDPGLLSEPREEEDRPEDEDDVQQPRKPSAKDRK